MLWVWVFPFLHPYRLHKFSFRYERCAFIGYTSSHKGYKCQSLLTGKIYISSNVISNKHCYPFFERASPHLNKHNSAHFLFVPFSQPSLQDKPYRVLGNLEPSLTSLGRKSSSLSGNLTTNVIASHSNTPSPLLSQSKANPSTPWSTLLHSTQDPCDFTLPSPTDSIQQALSVLWDTTVQTSPSHMFEQFSSIFPPTSSTNGSVAPLSLQQSCSLQPTHPMITPTKDGFSKRRLLWRQLNLPRRPATVIHFFYITLS